MLSLEWHPSQANVIGVTMSDGCVCLCESTQGELWGQDSIMKVTNIQSHGLEAWMLAFSADINGTMDVYSGGDDVILQRSSGNKAEEYTLLWQDRKTHQAGVTTILPLTSELVLTGSYDDHIRLISTPRVGRRQVLAEENIGGGVWRLKLLNTEVAQTAASASSALSDTTK